MPIFGVTTGCAANALTIARNRHIAQHIDKADVLAKVIDNRLG